MKITYSDAYRASMGPSLVPEVVELPDEAAQRMIDAGFATEGGSHPLPSGGIDGGDQEAQNGPLGAAVTRKARTVTRGGTDALTSEVEAKPAGSKAR